MAEKKKKKHTSQKETRTDKPLLGLALGKQNYQILIVGLVLIVLGFILMIGGGSDDPNVFNEKIFSTRRLTISPILIILGYLIEIVAIMKKPQEEE